MKIKSCKEIENMNPQDREQYYDTFKKECIEQFTYIKTNNFTRKFSLMLAKLIRKYDFEIIGKENIPTDERALFVINHSNGHDFFTMQEVFETLGIDKTFFASNEDLNDFILNVFSGCGGCLFNRNDSTEASDAFFKFTGNLLNGMPGVIFSESTWNLHPYKPMHLIKAGAINIAAITQVPIIPTIYEYVEVPYKVNNESKIYSKVIVKFGEPICISKNGSPIEQTNIVQKNLEQMRINMWRELGIVKDSIDDIDKYVYLNHTYLKKFCGPGEYITEREEKCLLIKDKLSAENEYHIDEQGNFVAGKLSKEEGKKYLLK